MDLGFFVFLSQRALSLEEKVKGLKEEKKALSRTVSQRVRDYGLTIVPIIHVCSPIHSRWRLLLQAIAPPSTSSSRCPFLLLLSQFQKIILLMFSSC